MPQNRPTTSSAVDRSIESLAPLRPGITSRLSLIIGITAVLTASSPSFAQESEINDEDVVQLSPFVITDSQDGYTANATLGGTRLRTELRDLGSSISVVTKQLLDDTASTDVEGLLVYTMGTEVGGSNGNFLDVGVGRGGAGYVESEESSLRSPQNSQRIRGLSRADNTRDYFLTDIPFDSFNTEQIDIQRGPNAILFGLGGAGGIINNNLLKAQTDKNRGKLQLRIDGEGSFRQSLDYNAVIVPNQFAVRLAVLNDNAEFRQKPAYEDDQRYYANFVFSPEFMNRGVLSGTTVRASFEEGDIEANRSRNTPLRDTITHWFENGKPLYSYADDAAFGDRLLDFPGRIFNHTATVYNDPNSTIEGGNGVPAAMIVNRNRSGATPRVRFFGVADYARYLRGARQDIPFVGLYRDRSLTDRSIFDYVNQMIDGPNKREINEWSSKNVTLEQFFFQDRSLGFEVSFDQQDYYEQQTVALVLRDGLALNIDLNEALIDGSPNPNFGRPFVGSDGVNSFRRTSDRESIRGTMFYKLNFDENLDNRLGKILGRHVFTGFYNEQDILTFSGSFDSWVTGPEHGLLVPNSGISTSNAFSGARRVATLNYLGPSLIGQPSPAGANLPGIGVYRVPGDRDTLVWNNRDKEFQTVGLSVLNYENTPDGLFRGGSKILSNIESKAVNWQSYFFGGKISGLLGWREDDLKRFAAPNSVRDPVTNAILVNDPRYVPAATPELERKDEITSWSIVAHSPDFVNQLLPEESEVSLFYNESENFNPSDAATDIFDNFLSPPTGTTKDMGLRLSLFDNKLIARVSRYEGSSANSRQQVISPFNAGSLEEQAIEAIKDGTASLTPESSAAAAAYTLPTARFLEVYEFSDATSADGQVTLGPNTTGGDVIDFTQNASFTDLSSVETEGYEFELSWNPNRNWNVLFNAAKTEVIRAGSGSITRAWLDSRQAVWEASRNLIIDESTGRTFGQELDSDVIRPLLLAEASNGLQERAVREWRFNGIANYTFREGRLNGFNIGGALRWQDAPVTGYGGQTIEGTELFDPQSRYYGDTELNGDAWIGYRTKILRDKVGLRIQLNARNLVRGDDLLISQVQPDGTPATFRIGPRTTWQLTSTFTF